MAQILEFGRVRRAFLGISYGEITPPIARQFRLPVDNGIIVLQVVPGSPAARAGLRPEDIIVGIDRVRIDSGGDLRRYLRTARAGQTVTIRYLRGRQERTASVRLIEAPNR